MKRVGSGGDKNLSPQQKRRAFVVALVVAAILFLSIEKEVVHSDDGVPTTPHEFNKPSSHHATTARPQRHDGDHAVFTGHEDIVSCKGMIAFPRKNIVGCEGYWAPYNPSGAAPLGDPSPFPNFKVSDFVSPFCGEVEWLRQLDYIEKVAGEDEKHDYSPSGLVIARQRGMSPSRVDGKLLGNKELRDFFAVTNTYVARNGGDDQHKIHLEHDFTLMKQRQETLKEDETVCWTGDLGPYYIRRFHAVPSEEFYGYVMNKYVALHE